MNDAARGLALALVLAGCGGNASAAGRQAGAEPLIGTWRGHADFRGARLEFGVRFFRERDSIRATFSSPDLLLLEQPLDSVSVSAPRVRFSTPDDHPVQFEGRLAGDWIRGGAAVPDVPGVVGKQASTTSQLRFELHRAGPSPVLPYANREVRFRNAGVELSGTLSMPPSPAAGHPGIVILQGSSSNLREEYRFYTDHFARAGMAVLAFDKRGTGRSSGDYGAATYDDLAADAAAAVAYLRAQPGVDASRVGVWGLSQGAFIAPLVARRIRSLAFVAAVSPPGVTIGESAAFQDSVRLVAKGFTTTDARAAALLNRQILAWLQTGKGGTGIDSALARVAGTPWRRASALPARIPASPALEGWYWRGRTLDPIPLWRAVHVPVLVVFGAADELLPAQASAERIERALRDGGNRDATVRVFPAANHVLRRLPLVAGGVWDWPRAAPGYLDTLTSWIVTHSR